jgi:hypothetical protein
MVQSRTRVLRLRMGSGEAARGFLFFPERGVFIASLRGVSSEQSINLVLGFRSDFVVTLRESAQFRR